MRFLNRPELRLRHHGDCRKQDRPVLAALETQHFSCVSLAQRDLAALAYDLDLDALRGVSAATFMRSCYHAVVRMPVVPLTSWNTCVVGESRDAAESSGTPRRGQFTTRRRELRRDVPGPAAGGPPLLSNATGRESQISSCCMFNSG